VHCTKISVEFKFQDYRPHFYPKSGKSNTSDDVNKGHRTICNLMSIVNNCVVKRRTMPVENKCMFFTVLTHTGW